MQPHFILWMSQLSILFEQKNILLTIVLLGEFSKYLRIKACFLKSQFDDNLGAGKQAMAIVYKLNQADLSYSHIETLEDDAIYDIQANYNHLTIGIVWHKFNRKISYWSI